MQNLKVKVNWIEESKEVQDLFFELGYSWVDGSKQNKHMDFPYLYASNDGLLRCGSIYSTFSEDNRKEITIQQLKDMVILKRNNVGDATHWHVTSRGNLPYLLLSNEWYFFSGSSWEKSTHKKDFFNRLESIQNNDLPFIDSEKDVKEYLEPMPNGDYHYHIDDGFSIGGDWIEIPGGAECAVLSQNTIYFFKSHYFKGETYKDWKNLGKGYDDKWYLGSAAGSRIVWQRNPQKESINDKVASAEEARQEMKADNVNNPNHYNKGGIECIEAIKASMTHEAFCGYLKGNIIKYTWRYEVKGGAESLQKAQWYTNRLLEELSNG